MFTEDQLADFAVEAEDTYSQFSRFAVQANNIPHIPTELQMPDHYRWIQQHLQARINNALVDALGRRQITRRQQDNFKLAVSRIALDATAALDTFLES